jgi:pyrimidine operon attenuation protein/uracil phosphoribosyltransferase
MKTLLNAEQIEQTLNGLADAILSDTPDDSDLAVVGIRSRGEVIAQRLAQRIARQSKNAVLCGTLDITLYRDDLNSPQGADQPQVRTTEISFSVDDKTIVLVDDVLFTGRSTRAAMDALIDLGRPHAIRLAVLVDRAGREFPIQADYTGLHTDIAPDQRVHVNLVESDGKDEVIVE